MSSARLLRKRPMKGRSELSARDRAGEHRPAGGRSLSRLTTSDREKPRRADTCPGDGGFVPRRRICRHVFIDQSGVNQCQQGREGSLTGGFGRTFIDDRALYCVHDHCGGLRRKCSDGTIVTHCLLTLHFAALLVKHGPARDPKVPSKYSVAPVRVVGRTPDSLEKRIKRWVRLATQPVETSLREVRHSSPTSMTGEPIDSGHR